MATDKTITSDPASDGQPVAVRVRGERRQEPDWDRYLTALVALALLGVEHS